MKKSVIFACLALAIVWITFHVTSAEDNMEESEIEMVMDIDYREDIINKSRVKVIDFEKDVGAVPDKDDLVTCWKNGGLINATFARLQPGDTFVFPNKTYHIMGGIQASNLKDVTLQFDGTLVFSDNMKQWPRDASGRVHECFHFHNIQNVTFTSSGMALWDGKGSTWWGIPGIGYLQRVENRPRLIAMEDSKNILFENIIMKNSPYWTFLARKVDGLEVRNSHIDARRTKADSHGIIDLTAFNTDGFDVTGKNVWIHDCTVWNQDDTIAVKDGSENMLFERIQASGVGLTIGSIGSSTVNNITFRDCNMHHTLKGIYMKFRGNGLISNVIYENIVMDEPEQYAIWIGPAQQSDSRDPCAAHPCSICWPTDPWAKCGVPAGKYVNITLRNITINNPKGNIGVILGNETIPMENLVLDNVVVNNPGRKKWIACEGAGNAKALGATTPVPSCVQKI